MAVDTRVIYIGNLRSDISKEELKGNIFDLITNYIGVRLAVGDITVKCNKGHGPCYVFVNCHEEHHAEYVLDQLSSWEQRRRLRFNFTLICEGSKPLKSDFKRDSGHKKKKSKKNKHYDDSFEVNDKFNDFYTNKHDQVNMDNGACKMQVSNLVPIRNGNPFTSFDQTQQENTVHSENYIDGYLIGTESRNREFKKGGGDYLKKVLKKHVSKYICAFLNSEEEGTLYIGVTDEGLVEGVECPQSKEDAARLTIDEAVKSIHPAVFTNMYGVKFTPVFYPTGVPKDNFKVIEIHVHPNSDLERLYECRDGVFLRRDGGVEGPMKATDIQEWSRQKHQKEIKILEERLKKQEDLFEKRLILESSHDKKSKVCIVM